MTTSKLGIKIQIFKIFTKVFSNFNTMLEKEYHQHILWYFIAFIYGIASYFTTNHFLGIPAILILILSSSICAVFTIRSNFLLGSFLLLLIASFASGLLISELRMRSITTTTLKNAISGSLTGIIEEVAPARGGIHVKISNITIDDFELPKLVARIKIAQTNLPDNTSIQPGNVLQGKVKLFPLQGPILPGGYEFGFFQYVRGIGASGFASEAVNITIINDDHNNILARINAFVSLVRNDMHQKMVDILGSEKGNFVSAILIGITSGIDKSTAEAMRGSGISHILSVSGLHLSLIAMIFFFISRVLLNMSNYIAYNWNIKMIASYIAIFMSFCYLILTGSKIAATRAFIMTSIFIIAHMIGKMPYAIRSLFIAALIILTAYPEYVMHPSFQLSFAAVLCLVSGYELYLRNQHRFGINSGILANMKFYFLTNIYTTILASIATSPFVIYHFFNVPGYGVIMNLLAVPLMSFVIMPLGSIVLLLYGSGVEDYILPIIGFFVGIIIDAAKTITLLPGSIVYFGYISKASLAIFSLGFFWLCVWNTTIKYFGWLIILFSVFLMFTVSKPSFIYDTRYNSLITQKDNGELIFYTKGKIPDFTKDFIVNWYGNPKYELININKKSYCSDECWLMKNQYNLEDNRSIYTINNKKVARWAKSRIKPEDIVLYQTDKVPPLQETNIHVPFDRYNSSRTIVGYCIHNTCRFEYSSKDMANYTNSRSKHEFKKLLGKKASG